MLDNNKIEDVSHFKTLVDDLTPGQSIPVLINRQGSPLFLALKVPQ
jgi:serine protease Do